MFTGPKLGGLLVVGWTIHFFLYHLSPTFEVELPCGSDDGSSQTPDRPALQLHKQKEVRIKLDMLWRTSWLRA